MNPAIYLNYLALTTDVTLPCDTTAKELLDRIAVHKDAPLTVSETMSLVGIASPATIHRKLNDLIEVGLVEMIYKGNNRRTKYVVATDKAMTYFKRMSDGMKKAMEVRP